MIDEKTFIEQDKLFDRILYVGVGLILVLLLIMGLNA